MSTILVTTRQGSKRTVLAAAGTPLMETLRNHNLDVEAVCGGSISCATCHVYVASEWLPKLGPPGEFERDLLGGLIHSAETSRLSCQIIITADMEGLAVTIAPSE